MAGRSLAALVIVALAFSLLLLFGSTENASAVTWKIHYSTTLSCAGDDVLEGNANDSCAAPAAAPGKTADTRSIFQVDSQGLDGAPHKHSNFATIRTLNSPPEWSIVKGSAISDGALRGRLVTTATLSVLNGPCSTAVPINIPLFDSTTDVNKPVDWLGDGENLMSDPDSNGFPEYVDKYPTYLKDLADPDHGITGLGGLIPTLKPWARLAGSLHAVAGAPSSKLNFMIFAPGQLGAFRSPYPDRQLGDTLGWINFVVLDNPTSPATPSSITEFCEPLSTDTKLFGKTQGQGALFAGPNGTEFDVPVAGSCLTNPANPLCLITAQTNPAANTGIWTPPDGTGAKSDTHLGGAWGISNRDADADGIVNNEDGCALAAGTVDTDNDGIEDVCDPTPGTNSNGGDHDLDGFQNRQDNCAINANADQSDQDSIIAPADGGGGDGIGDACDPNPLTADTEGPFLVDMVRSAVCLGTDTDLDGWCDDAETALGSNTGDNTSVPEHKSLDVVLTGPPSVPGNCSNLAWYASAGDPAGAGAAIDDDGDTQPNGADAGCAALGSDTDQDGVPNTNDNCPSNYNPEQLNTDGDSTGDACDSDDDGDGISDWLEWQYGGQPKNSARYDWGTLGLDVTGDGLLTILDVQAYRGNVGKAIPQAGTAN